MGVHDSFLSDMIKDEYTKTLPPFHARIFVDNNGEREPEKKKVKDCDNQAQSYLKRSPLKREGGTSLVAQWLRICLPMQGTWV